MTGVGFASRPAGRTGEPTVVGSVDRALRLLVLLQESESVSVKDAAEHLGTAPSTAHRLLSTLSSHGFAVQDYMRRYRAGPALSGGTDQVGSTAAPAPSVADCLSDVPVLLAGLPLQFVRLDRGQLRVLSAVNSESLAVVSGAPRTSAPAFVSAAGKAILSRMTNRQIEELYGNGFPSWPGSRIDSLRALKRAMTSVRSSGYATSSYETIPGYTELGVSVNLRDGSAAGALSLWVPSVGADSSALSDYVASLREVASRVAAKK